MTMIKPRILIDKRTGEIIHAREVIKDVSSQNFMKAQMVDLLLSLGIIGGKSVRVYAYILNHMNFRTNRLYQNNRQIKKGMASEGNKVSLKTIMRVLNKLESTEDIKGRPLLTRHRYGKYGRHSYLMLDPDIMYYGTKKRHSSLLISYRKAGVNKSNHHAKKSYPSSERSAQNKAHSKHAKGHQVKKSSHESHNANGLTANAQQLNMFDNHQDYSAKKSDWLYGKNKKPVKN